MKNFLTLIVLIFIFQSCARVGRPTGGQKDKLPPISISATPDFESVNFKSEKIKISFNEYIKFKDLNKQLVISPPMTIAPIITPIGYPSKNIVIELKDSLKQNTTYTFNFGNSIIDNTEGNQLKRFKYLFSTGDFIDSLQVTGEVQDAYLQKVNSNISVMLYTADSSFYDSIIYHKKPNYITNTLDSIGFTISNIKNGMYYIYALEDLNNNMLFNPKDEKIAFQEKAFHVLSDSIFQLKLFSEIPDFKIKSIFQESKNHLIIGYEGKLEAIIKELKDKVNNSIDFISYKDKETDSIHVWYKGIDRDSIFLKIKKQDTIITKSIRLRSKEVDSIQVSSNIKHTLHYNDSLFLVSKTPLSKVETQLIKLVTHDTIDVGFKVIKESFFDRFLIDFNKEEDAEYQLIILPNAITDFLGHTNDSIQFKFKTKKKNYYGDITFSCVTEKETQLIVELLTEKGKLLKTKILDDSKKVIFNFLKPGKYKIRVIFDENVNNIWDTGNLLKKVQPERIIYFPKTIEVRSKWSISEEFLLK